MSRTLGGLSSLWKKAVTRSTKSNADSSMADKSGDSPKEGSEKVELLTPEKTKDDSDIEQLTSVLQGLPKYARHRKRPSLQEVIPKNVPVVVLPDRPASDTENDAKDSDVKNEECRLRADSYSKFKNLKGMLCVNMDTGGLHPS